MLSRQDRRQIIKTYLIGLLILACGCMIVYKLVYEPLKAELIQLHDHLSESTPASYRLPQVSLGAYQPWYASLKLSSQQLRQRFMHVINHAQVSLQELRFDTVKSTTPLSTTPIYMKLQGQFSQVMRLLVTLSNSHLVYSLEQIHLARARGAIEAVLHLDLRTLG